MEGPGPQVREENDAQREAKAPLTEAQQREAAEAKVPPKLDSSELGARDGEGDQDVDGSMRGTSEDGVVLEEKVAAVPVAASTGSDAESGAAVSRRERKEMVDAEEEDSEGHEADDESVPVRKQEHSVIMRQNRFLYKLTNCRIANARFNIHSLRYKELRNIVILILVGFFLALAWALVVIAISTSILYTNPNLDPEEDMTLRFRILQEGSLNATNTNTTAPSPLSNISSPAPTARFDPAANSTLSPLPFTNSNSTAAPSISIALNSTVPTSAPTETIGPTRSPEVATKVPTVSPTFLPTISPTVAPTIEWNETIVARQVLALQTADLSIRLVISAVLTLGILWFCVKIKRIIQNGTAVGIVSAHLQVWQEENVIVLIMLLVTWMINTLNPFVTSVEFSLVGSHPCSYRQDWEVRYNAILNSIFVAGLFYVSIYCFKHIRLDMHLTRNQSKHAEKRFEPLRFDMDPDRTIPLVKHPSTSTIGPATSALQFTTVRSTSGLLPRVIVLYAVLRVALGIAFAFDMGFVPAIAWISVVRACRMSDEPYWDECQQEFSCLDDLQVIRLSLVTSFCVWEICMLIWLFAEARRTWKEISTSMLLISRPQLVAYFGLSILFLLQWAGLLFCGLLMVSALPMQVLFTNELMYTGASALTGGLGIVIITWMFSLAWAFIPLGTTHRASKVRYVASEEQASLIARKISNTGNSHVSDSAHSESTDSTKSPTLFELLCKCLQGESSRSNQETNSVTNELDDYLDESRPSMEMVLLNKPELEPQTDTRASPKVTSPTQTSERGKSSRRDQTKKTEFSWQSALERTRGWKAPRLFIMEDLVLMWNIAHLTYLTGNSTYRQSEADVQLLVEDDRLVVVEQFFDSMTEAYCVVLEGRDRIVVGFRGNGTNLPVSTHEVNDLQLHRTTRQRRRNSGMGMTGSFMSSKSSKPPSVSTTSDSFMSPTDVEMQENYNSSVGKKLFHSAYGVTGKQIDMVARIRADLWAIYLRIADKVVTTVLELQRRRKRHLYLTGHGFGGAFAAFLALDLRAENQSVTVYTFGMPHLCNRKFRRTYARQVPYHFDVTTSEDKLHGKPNSSRYGVVHVGTCVVLDKIGNIILKPDRLETAILYRLKNKRLHGHTPQAYILALVQAVYRMHGADYKPLWSSSIHEIKLKCKPHTLASSYVREYMENSVYGQDGYRDEACLEVKVVRVTGLEATRSMCIVSCGPPGINSSFWEVAKTSVSPLSRSTWNNLAMTQDKQEAVEAVSQLEGEAESELSRVEEGQPLVGDAAERGSVGSTGGESLVSGVDMDALAAVPACYADFSRSAVMCFGEKQKLRPCARLTFSGIDASNGGENFGTASISVAELLPLEGGVEKEVVLPLEGRAHEDGVELKVFFTVKSVGGQSLESMSAVQRHIDMEAQGNIWLKDDDKSKLKKKKGVKLSHAMATYYLKKNFNRETRCVVLRLGVMKASLRDLDFRELDTPDLEGKARSNMVFLFCKVFMGAYEKGFTQVVPNGISPEWNAMFTFGRQATLTGFEEIVVEVKAKYDPQNLGQALLDEGKPIELDSFPGQVVTAGKLTVRFSAILPQFQDKDRPLIKWLPLNTRKPSRQQASKAQPSSSGHVCLFFEVATEPLESSASASVADSEHSNWTSTKLSNDGLADQIQQPSTGVSSSKKLTSMSSRISGRYVCESCLVSLEHHPLLTAKSGDSSTNLRALVPCRGRYLPNCKVLSKFDCSTSSGNVLLKSSDYIERHMQLSGPAKLPLSKQAPGLIPCEMASREWQEQCLESKDERAYVVTVYVHQALNLQLPTSRFVITVMFVCFLHHWYTANASTLTVRCRFLTAGRMQCYNEQRPPSCATHRILSGKISSISERTGMVQCLGILVEETRYNTVSGICLYEGTKCL